MRLFIIGNGFDLDHKIDSRFSDFKSYLENTYLPTFNKNIPAYPTVGVNPDGEEVVDCSSAAQILYALVENVPSESDWSDFESCLGKLDYQEVLDLVFEDDEEPSHYYHNLEDIVRSLHTSLLYCVTGLFCEWIDQLQLSNAKRKYSFNDDDLFLTFNYTPLLEKLYKVRPDRICHIHGSMDSGLCIIGHGDQDRDFGIYDEFVSFELTEIHDLLRKDVERIYQDKISFFKKVYESRISSIVFFGFSFSDIDTYYLEQIFTNIDTSNTSAYLSPFEDKNERDAKVLAMELLGFKGTYAGAI